MFNPNAIGVGADESLVVIVAYADGVAVKHPGEPVISGLIDH